jgi:hypothetical protein
VNLQNLKRTRMERGNDNPNRIAQNVLIPSRDTVAVGTPYRPLLAYNCLIIPVFFGIWWYWVRRKANAVLQKLMVKNRPDNAHEHDEATTTAQPQGRLRSKLDGRDRPWDHVNHDSFSTWCVRFGLEVTTRIESWGGVYFSVSS